MTTLTYRIPEEALFNAISGVNCLHHSDEMMAFAYFFDAIEQSQLVAGYDLAIEVNRGYAPARTKNGGKAIGPLYVVKLTFADADKAMLFKLSHVGGDA